MVRGHHLSVLRLLRVFVLPVDRVQADQALEVGLDQAVVREQVEVLNLIF